MMRSCLLALLLVIIPASSPGHTDVSETIKALSSKIAGKATADLYYQRATEFRALRESDHAIEDLRAALKLEPKHRQAKISLIRALGKSDEALAMATSYLVGGHSAHSAIEAAYLVAHIHHLRGENVHALAICEKIQALAKSHENTIDLLHADILLDLARPADAAAILKNSWQRTQSIVVRNNWIDLALTAGQTTAVLPIISEELSSSRFRSSWLIRRARASLILKKPAEARADLSTALLEITPRIHPERPDLTLITDRGLVHALMGNPVLARRDLEELRKSSLPPAYYRLLSDTLAKR